MARTHASHAWNTGSIPVGATKERPVPFFFLFGGYAFLVSTHASRSLFFSNTGVDSHRRYQKSRKAGVFLFFYCVYDTCLSRIFLFAISAFFFLLSAFPLVFHSLVIDYVDATPSPARENLVGNIIVPL